MTAWSVGERVRTPLVAWGAFRSAPVYGRIVEFRYPSPTADPSADVKTMAMVALESTGALHAFALHDLRKDA